MLSEGAEDGGAPKLKPEPAPLVAVLVEALPKLKPTLFLLAGSPPDSESSSAPRFCFSPLDAVDEEAVAGAAPKPVKPPNGLAPAAGLLLEVVVEEGGAPKLNPLPAAFGALSSLAAPKPPKGEALPVLSAPPKLPNGLEVEGAGVGAAALSGALSAAAPKKFGTLFFGASLAGCAGALAAGEPKLKPPEGVLPPKGAAAGLLSSADLPKEKVGAGEGEGEALFSVL